MKPTAVLVSLVSLLTFLVLTFNTTYARAETVACTPVGPLPFTIDSPGNYCLKSNRTLNVAVTFGAITINSNSVVLDLNGFRLRGRGTLDSHDIGILCSKCRNVTVKNGTVQGFAVGIHLGSPDISEGNVVEDIRAVRNSHIGISVGGHGALVRNNHILETGANTATAFGNAIGISVEGTASRIINNDIITVITQPTFLTAYGIDVVTRTGPSFPRPADHLAINNRITNVINGIRIRFGNTDGKCRDNITSSVSTPYAGCIDAGNND